jgi:hypothetical protein
MGPRVKPGTTLELSRRARNKEYNQFRGADTGGGPMPTDFFGFSVPT